MSESNLNLVGLAPKQHYGGLKERATISPYFCHEDGFFLSSGQCPVRFEAAGPVEATGQRGVKKKYPRLLCQEKATHESSRKLRRSKQQRWEPRRDNGTNGRTSWGALYPAALRISNIDELYQDCVGPTFLCRSAKTGAGVVQNAQLQGPS